MDIKNLITTIAAYVLAAVGAIDTYIKATGTGEIDWLQLTIVVILAIVGVLTGRNADGTKKTKKQVATQEAQK